MNKLPLARRVQGRLALPVERGVFPYHLRGDGSVETTAVMEARLVTETGVGEGVLDGLFAATLTDEERRQMLAEAYRIQSQRKAFRLRLDQSGLKNDEV